MSDIETKTTKWQRIKNDPIPAIGMTGFFSIVGYSIYNYRKRGSQIRPSLYVIQTRMAAQGLVITLLTVGLGMHMYQNWGKYNREDDK